MFTFRPTPQEAPMPALTLRNALPADAARCFEIETTAYEGDEAATLEKVLEALRPHAKGKLLCLFGCGG